MTEPSNYFQLCQEDPRFFVPFRQLDGVDARRLRLDYFICNKAFQHCTLAEEGSIKASASPLSRIELGSDHCCISLTVALQDLMPLNVEPSLPRKRFHATNCKRWNVSPGLLQQKLTECIDDFKGADLHGQWEILTRTAKAVSFPRTSLKFIDSPMLKGLCFGGVCVSIQRRELRLLDKSLL